MPNHPPMHNEITGVILAGGRATRLGGVDKGLVTLAGQPLIEHALARLQGQVGTIIINANRNRARYLTYGYPVIDDDRDDYAGPLAGILAALHATTSRDIVIVPVDMPLLPDDLVARLLQARADRAAACVHDGERLQPLCALLSTSLRNSLANFIDNGGRKVHDWMESLTPAIADYADQAAAFRNLNTPEALSSLDGGHTATSQGPA